MFTGHTIKILKTWTKYHFVSRKHIACYEGKTCNDVRNEYIIKRLLVENHSKEPTLIIENAVLSPKQVFNVDEKGLLWKRMSSHLFI